MRDASDIGSRWTGVSRWTGERRPPCCRCPRRRSRAGELRRRIGFDDETERAIVQAALEADMEAGYFPRAAALAQRVGLGQVRVGEILRELGWVDFLTT